MSVTEARALCAELDVRPWDEHSISDAVLAATTSLLAASPQVTAVADTPGMWWIGATGFSALGGEYQLANTLLTIARQWHPDARVAIADNCITARAATWAPRPHQNASVSADRDTTRPAIIVPVGDCATYLAPAPIGLLPISEDVRESLNMLGVRTVGALAALDAGNVEHLWGADGLAAWRLACGHDPYRPSLVRVEAARRVSVELPNAVESAEPILFVIHAQLQRLLHECVQDGRAAAAVAVTLTLDAGRSYPLEQIGSEMAGHTRVPDTSDDRSASTANTPSIMQHWSVAQGETRDLLSIPQRTITREIRPARPLARLAPLFDQCRALLNQWSVPAPVIAVTVSIPTTAPLAADQGDLMVPSWRDAATNAEAVLARLRATLDPEQHGDVVVHPESRDTHRPEQAGAWISADAVALASAALSIPSSSHGVAEQGSAHDTTAAVLRMLGNAESIQVDTVHRTPVIIRWRGKRLSLRHAHGPERLSGDWWRGDSYARDYWRVFAESDGELLIYHEDRSWYVQGWYD